jgi:hypothetical protein
MTPWMRDALVLGMACRSLRLAQDRKGVWRPTATATDVERAFEMMALALRDSEHEAFADAKRVEETERLRLAVQALASLALSRGAPETEVASLLRGVLMDAALFSRSGDPPPIHRFTPAWALERARRRISRAGKPGSPLSEPAVPPILPLGTADDAPPRTESEPPPPVIP